jgi:hypothetical protein
MQLTDSVRKRLAREYEFAATQINEAADVHTKLYFFSVFYTEANRALNDIWDSDLALLHLVLQSVHQTISARFLTPLPGLGMPNNVIEELTKSSMELAKMFNEKHVDQADLLKVLARFAELAYATTGNGYYLYVKGNIKI